MCVWCVCFSEIRCDITRLHLKCVGRKGQTERKSKGKKDINNKEPMDGIGTRIMLILTLGN